MDEIEINRLGADGCGVDAAGGRHAFALPGERIVPGTPPRIVTPAPERIAPACRHFGTCGGCALQHASEAFLAQWKREAVVRALAARGLSAPMRPVAVSPPHSRRRAVLAARRTKKTVQVGFHVRRSDRIVDIVECPLVVPGMLGLIPVLREIARRAASRKGALRLSVTASGAGWDVDVGGGKPLDTSAREGMAGLADGAGIARLAWDGEVVVQARPPAQAMGRAQVVPPPGAFLQATAEGESALVAAVREGVGDAARVADLFCGCGTFALPLAERAEVWAVEADAGMLAALDAGWRGASGLKLVRTEARDLFARPLEPLELKGVDAVVFDPPRAGAEAQAMRLAASGLTRVVAVSCNPVTFARDAGLLVGAGFRLDWVQVVDQFRWSPHVELVAAFRR